MNIIFLQNSYYSLKQKIFNILIISLIFTFLCIHIFFKDKSLEPIYLKIKGFEDSYSNSFIKSFFENPISEMKKFRELNFKNSFFYSSENKKVENPDISVIITVYNQAHCFHGALRSVQNQSLKNIEIIIIDDCSLDNITEVIKNYTKEDKRIIYIRHESNDGKIKSRSDGIRMAKGKYITIIDGDDALSNDNILFKSFTIANLSNLDVIIEISNILIIE